MIVDALASSTQRRETAISGILRQEPSLQVVDGGVEGEVLSLLDNETGMHSCLESKHGVRSHADAVGECSMPVE